MGGRFSREAGGVAMGEVEKHTSKNDAWLVLFGEAIDVTRFIPLHPGGESMIEAYLGKDATEDWQSIHKPEDLDKHWDHLTKMGKIKGNGGMLSWLFGRVSAPASASTPAVPASAPARQAEGAKIEDADEGGEQKEEEVARVRWTAEHEAELPPGGAFDLQELSRWDGVQLPMCIGICGIILDVSSSDNFVPNFGYGKLWAGRDTTWAMATVSLKAEDANKFDFTLDQLSPENLDALGGWYKHFTTKYRRVGTLKNWEGMDWSSVEELAAKLPASSMSAA